MKAAIIAASNRNDTSPFYRRSTTGLAQIIQMLEGLGIEWEFCRLWCIQPHGDAVQVVSSSANDKSVANSGQLGAGGSMPDSNDSVIIKGITTAGVVTTETVHLNGTTAVETTEDTWEFIWSIQKTPTVGNITLQTKTGPTVMLGEEGTAETSANRYMKPYQTYVKNVVETDYDMAIFPYVRSGGEWDHEVYPWINGLHTIPTYIMSAAGLLAQAGTNKDWQDVGDEERYTGLRTGVSAATNLAVGANNWTVLDATNGDGISAGKCYTSNYYAYTIDGTITDAPATSLLTIAAAEEQVESWGGAAGDPTKTVAWYRDWTTDGGSLVVFSDMLRSHPAVFLAFLNKAGLTPPKPYRIYMELDDVNMQSVDVDLTHCVGSESGLSDLGDWLRTNGTLMLCGLGGITLAAEDTPANGAYTNAYYAALVAVLNSYSDVYPCFVHNHANTEAAGYELYWWDDTNYPTTDDKLTGWRAKAAWWETTAGVNRVNVNGYGGFINLPNNASTWLGRLAIAKAGVKAIRLGQMSTTTLSTTNVFHGLARRGDYYETLVDPDDGTRYALRWVKSWYPFGTKATWATCYALVYSYANSSHASGSTQECLCAVQQEHIPTYMCEGAEHVYFHGSSCWPDNSAPTAGDSAVLTLLKLGLAPLVNMANDKNIMRFATTGDWAEAGGRR